MFRRVLIWMVTSLLIVSAQAQTLKGVVRDRQTEMPLIGANIVLTSVVPTRGTISDMEGRFTLDDVTPGRHDLQISYLGYDPIVLPNILVTSGKDVVLEIGLEEALIKMEEIVVTAAVEKDKAGNEMATISSRMFTLEEVTRYSGGRNDASRMAANFAGVNIADDSRNDIVIRGNSPTGVLWRMEGIPIPNPNHFATLGTTGGPVSALNTNLLKNSDFMTSAFPAEYGNANAGVFDIQLRSGNRDKFEFTGQLAAFSGLEFMAEGPLSSKKKGSSFVASYRHSFVELADVVGLNVGTNAIPRYKDLTFKIDLGRHKSGSWSVFGLAATSDIDFLAKDVQDDDFFAAQDEDSYATSLIGLIGINHSLLISDRSYVRTTLGYSTSANTFDVDRYSEGLVTKDRVFEVDDQNTRLTLSSYVNTKLSAGLNVRSGILLERYALNAFARDKDDDRWRTLRDFDDHLMLYQAFSQAQWKPNRHITLNVGLHIQYLDFNGDFALEPRAGINWHLTGQQQISLGFGLHNQMLPLPIYIYETIMPDGTSSRTNADVSFLKSAHYVLGYDKRLGTDWRIKSEVYYQDLIDVPVEKEISSFSILNVGANFGFPEVGFLQNTGSGANYGAELTIEKFFSKNYYLLATGSLFQSKYAGSDRIQRNTAFNNNYVFNILGGKEFLFSKEKKNAITFDIKFTMAGGRYYTPIDLDASIQLDQEVLREEVAFSERHDPYLRLDLKFGYRLNNSKKGYAQQFFLDFQNFTNRKNVFVRRFNRSTGRIDTINQIGFFPDVLYRIQF